MKVGHVLTKQRSNQWQVLLVDGTGFGFYDRYEMMWQRGQDVRQTRAHVRLVLLTMADQKGDGILRGAAVGPPYASEVQLVREILALLSHLPPLPVVADRAYDAVDVMEAFQQRGALPAIRIKSTWRYTPRHPLRRSSQSAWNRWGALRSRVEGFFGLMKRKLGHLFPLRRQDLAMRRALAAALLYNFDRLVVFFCRLYRLLPLKYLSSFSLSSLYWHFYFFQPPFFEQSPPLLTLVSRCL